MQRPQFSLERVLMHPASWVASALTVLGGVFQLPFASELWMWLLNSSGSLFTATSIAAFTIAPEVEGFSAGVLRPVAIVLGGVFIAAQLRTAFEKLQERL
jgi:hypothetical protein